MKHKNNFRDFPGGPGAKNLPSNAGDAGSVPGRGTKIPHALGQLIPRAATARSGAHVPQLARSPQNATKILCAAIKMQHSKINKIILKNEKLKKKLKQYYRTPLCDHGGSR